MTIEKIKKALHEVSKICAKQNFCANCPLSVDGKCPMWTVNERSTFYPEEWALDYRNVGGGSKA